MVVLACLLEFTPRSNISVQKYPIFIRAPTKSSIDGFRHQGEVNKILFPEGRRDDCHDRVNGDDAFKIGAHCVGLMEILLDMSGWEWEEVVLSAERKTSREPILVQYIPRFILILYTPRS